MLHSSWQKRVIACGELQLELGTNTQIMGILNVTPDSFSDGGSYMSVDSAVRQALRMVDEGADLIDIGGESTRPGSEEVGLEEELGRLLPVVKALKGSVNVPISVDTYKAETARLVLEAGAHIINDIWGCKRDPGMAQVAAEYECPIILMHNRADMDYGDFLADVRADLLESVRIAKDAGVQDDKIILDPGIGFAKTYEHNLFLLGRLDAITDLGYPVLLGTSRKSTIRRVLDLPVDDVVEGTVATTVLGISQGCDIVRVHDVRQNKRAAMMADAVVRGRFDL